MGAEFRTQHANLVAYLTSSSRGPAPHADRDSLREFVESLFSNIRRYKGVDWGARHARRDALVSSRGSWVEQIRSCARDLFAKHFEATRLPDVCDPAIVAAVLDPLREFFTGYHFYALILTDRRSNERGRDLLKYLAVASQGDGMILLPTPDDDFVDIADPFPMLQTIADSPIAPPSVAFWTSKGASCVLSFDEAKRLFDSELFPALHSGAEKIDEIIRSRSKRSAIRRILHMSDLHFGKPEAGRRRRYIKDHLGDILGDIDRVVITGDLFDSPDPAFRSEFDDFRLDVEEMTKREVIVIPGNHDVRTIGNKVGGLGEDFQQFVGIRWNPVVVDNDLKAVFFCFNSAEGGNFARGMVSEQQRLHVAAEYARERRKASEISAYLKVALVHHHPFRYGKNARGRRYAPPPLYERILAFAFKNEDEFLAFENAEEFLSWCSSQNVSLILHGHKHMPRTMTHNASLVVGCGSTTGVENTPMCYDVISYDAETMNWSASFYYDPASDGSGFKRQNVILTSTMSPAT